MAGDLQGLAENLAKRKQMLTKRQVERDFYDENLKEVKSKILSLNLERDLLDKVRILFQLTADHARNQAKLQLETLVTNTLQYIFGPQFKFEIQLTEHGGNPVAEFYVTTEWEGESVSNKPQDARGGGIVDIVSIALRIAYMESMQPKVEGPIILDEPGKHVSDDYIVQMVEFLRSISTTFDRQIILVSHNTHLIESADAAYMVNLQGTRSVVNNAAK